MCVGWDWQMFVIGVLAVLIVVFLIVLIELEMNYRRAKKQRKLDEESLQEWIKKKQSRKLWKKY